MISSLFASCADIKFDDFKVSRVDWAVPATPTWQVYAGDFGITSNPPAATLSVDPRDVALAVREGTYMGDGDIEVQLLGGRGAIAFRVKDKLNFYYADVDVSEQWCIVTLDKVVDGLHTYDVMYGHVPFNDLSPNTHLHIKFTDANLGVWVEDEGTWLTVISPTGSGQGVLSEHAAGSVGLAQWWIGDTTTCTLLKVGTITGGGHTMTDAQAAVVETFATSVVPGYDAAGNMTNDGIYKYKYDAWNRLVEVGRQGPTSNPQVVAQYGYDGLGRRIKKVVSNSGDKDGTQYFYYNNRWQLLEIDNADGVARQQFVWGSNYIDEAICMDVDTGTDGDCTDESSRHFFYMQDANWSVTGLWEDMGSGPQVVERYEYDPYGTVRIYRGSASAGAAEQRSVTGQSLKWLSANLPSNPIVYCGYFCDSDIGKYQVRHREDDPQTERWMQTEPLKYADGMNLYLYAKSSPEDYTDQDGLRARPTTPPPSTQPAPALKITVKTPPRRKDSCGGCFFMVQWEVTGHPRDGWVIQHVKWEGEVLDDYGKPVVPTKTPLGSEYWEGWQVANGEVWNGFHTAGSAHGFDTFSTSSEGLRTKGKISIVGKVALLEGYDLTIPPWGHTVREAGPMLPTSGPPGPSGWNETGAQDHILTCEWDCTCDPKKPIVLPIKVKKPTDCKGVPSR